MHTASISPYQEGNWYKNGVVDLSINTTSLGLNYTQGTLTLISTLDSGNTTKGDNWSCIINSYDGESYSSSLSSGNLTILNTLPTHTQPILNATTSSNLTSDNLTVYNQSTADADNDAVRNIIAWFNFGNPPCKW